MEKSGPERADLHTRPQEVDMSANKLVYRMQACDARIKMAVSIVAGVCVWKAGPVALGLFAFSAAGVAWMVAGRGLIGRGQLKGLVYLAGAWTAIKACLELYSRNPQWLEQSLLLGGRLAVLVLVGVCLAALTSRVQVGLALSSLLRPLCGTKSWQAALSLALMIHFIPLALGTLQTVKRTLSLRGQDLSMKQRMHFFVTTVMRTLSRTTWDQTLALAVRGLEEEKAWQQSRPITLKEWAGAGVLGLSLVVLAAVG
ncbi:MAG: energy-coupling factor transporter transmembrane component T [Desulfovermiculus sp.]